MTTMRQQIEADRITMIIAGMTFPELVAAQDLLLKHWNECKVISLRRILADKVNLIEEAIQERGE